MGYWYLNNEDIRKSNGSSFQNQPPYWQTGFDIILTLYKSLFKKEPEHVTELKL
jgi:hypothetical protein